MKYSNDQQEEFRELADWIIDQTKKAGAQDCKVSLSKRRMVEINYRDHKPEVIKEATTKNLSLEVFINNRYALQSTPDFRRTTLTGFVSDVIDSAKVMEEDKYRTLPDPKYYQGRTTKDLQLSDPDYDGITPEKRHEMAKVIEDACLAKGGDKVISVQSSVNDETNEEYVKSSNGLEGSNKSTYSQCVAEMTARDENDRRPQGYDYAVSRFNGDLPSLEKIGTGAAERTLDLLGARKISTVRLPVIVENREVGRLLGNLVYPMSAAAIQRKMSFLADKQGKRVGSRMLTIKDDPFINRGLGSLYYDNDGFPSRQRDLFSEGMLNEFLVDWYYSRKLGWKPTSGEFSNIIIPAGTRSPEEIIRSLDKCIMITGFIGGNSNPATGDFSVGIIGKLYEKGAPVQNIAEMNIADNHLNFWNKLIENGNDPWIYSQVRSPSLVFEDVIVSGV